jgi:hypothetical protein
VRARRARRYAGDEATPTGIAFGMRGALLASEASSA